MSGFYDVYHDEALLRKLDHPSPPRPDDVLIATLAGTFADRPPETILDIGCGSGEKTLQLAKTFPQAQVAGIDPYEPAIRNALQERPASLADRISYLQGNINAMPFEDHSTDLIWCFDMMCHVPCLKSALCECRRVIQPEGQMALCTALCSRRMDHVTWEDLSEVGLHRESMQASRLETALAESGWDCVEQIDFRSEFLEALEKEDPGRVKDDLIRLSALIRESDTWITHWGETRYRQILGLLTFNLAILTGKLGYSFFRLVPKSDG